MASRFQRSRPPGRRSQRSPGTWARFHFVNTTLSAGSKILLGSFVPSNPGIDETVRRVIVTTRIQSDQAAANEPQEAAIGLWVANDVGVALGVTALPGPLTDLSDDGWFLWQGLLSANTLTGDTGTDTMFHVQQFESRAMRKIEEGQRVAILVEVGASFSIQLAVFMSMFATRTR